MCIYCRSGEQTREDAHVLKCLCTIAHVCTNIVWLLCQTLRGALSTCALLK